MIGRLELHYHTGRLEESFLTDGYKEITQRQINIHLIGSFKTISTH